MPLYRYIHHSGAEIIVELCLYRKIPDMILRPPQKVHIPENSRHAAFILVFKVGTVAPFKHQNADDIFTIHQTIGYIKLGCGMGNLTITQKSAIHPQIKAESTPSKFK